LAYTAYRTWTTGEIVTAALMNEQVKDNGLLTAPAIMTGQGDLIYGSAANTPARLAKDANATRSLTNTGSSNNPAWAQVALATGVSGTLPVANGGTGITSLGSNVATFLGTPSSANLRSALTDETGTGGAVFATSPTLVTPALGTPSAGVLTSCTGLPEAGLAVSNSPTNGYMLTAQSGDAGGMTWAAAGSGLDAASQAEMEAASSNTVAATPGRTNYHPGVAKVWCHLNGTGTAAIVESHNVTSMTDNSTGDYLITIATDFASAGYAFVTGSVDGVVNNLRSILHGGGSGALGSISVLHSTDDATSGVPIISDATRVMVVAFGDQA
jgi:hypothetical protein